MLEKPRRLQGWSATTAVYFDQLRPIFATQHSELLA
jgi:hypothetical protein